MGWRQKLSDGVQATFDAVQQKAEAAADAAEPHVGEHEDQVLGGPAGAFLWGKAPVTTEPGEQPSVRGELKKMRKMLGETARDLNDPKGLLGIGSDLPAGIKDPAERARVAAAERAERDRARGPYLGSSRPEIHFTRIATRGKTQFEQLAAHLASTGLAACPHLVYGAYRVPDRISPLMQTSEKDRVVEWEIVHAPTGALGPAAEPEWLRFDARERLVERNLGDPMLIDEELGIAAMQSAGAGPELSLGIAREVVMDWTHQGYAEFAESAVYGRVDGVRALPAPGTDLAPGPLAIPCEGLPGTWIEVMNWWAVAEAIHPRPQRQPEIPSPFAYLPSTPQELLAAYIEVVGLDPADCYSVAATIDSVIRMGERTTRDDHMVSLDDLKLTDAPKLPCADGEDRRRYHGATHLVIAYRDRPEYGEGRARWAAYQRDVLHARLELRTGVRRLIGGDTKVERIALSAERAIDKLPLGAKSPEERYGRISRYVG